jgi:hypothetical protein
MLFVCEQNPKLITVHSRVENDSGFDPQEGRIADYARPPLAFAKKKPADPPMRRVSYLEVRPQYFTVTDRRPDACFVSGKINL